MDSDSLSQLLRQPVFNRGATAPVVRETHISWVILAGDAAYKIKKPVDFGFLDFSTLEKRRHFCELELALNRRFAPELYQAVVPITGGPEGPQVAGSGPVIDYAVRMRRFDEASLLSNIAARGELDRDLIRALGRELAHQQDTAQSCHPAPDSDAPGSPAALRAAMEQNFRQVRAYSLPPGEQRILDSIERWTLQHHSAQLPLMEQRLAADRVLDGHGDAHLGNIALIDGRVRLFDCIEFNPAMRIMDGMAEIAFLCMDLQARDYEAQSHCLLGDYLEYRGDYGGLALLDMYRCYFAMVRAKVALLREPADRAAITGTAAYRDFRRYLALADSCGRPPAPFVAITHGVSGTGKSTVADKLVAASGAVRIRSDVERKRLFGLAPEERSTAADEPALYGEAMTRKTMQRLAELAQQIVSAGFAVIVDATFLQRRNRDCFYRLASERQLPFVIVECKAPQEEVQRRLHTREIRENDASEANVSVMQKQLARVQPLGDDERRHALTADSGESESALWQRFEKACKAEP